MRVLIKLTWLEVKIFLREPMGVFGTAAVPLLMFFAFSRVPIPVPRGISRVGVYDTSFPPVLAAMMLVIAAITSLVAIISIYREGGILKRLRATPLRPLTILTAHVLVKLVFTLVTVLLLVAAGRRFYPAGAEFPAFDFVAAMLCATFSLLSIGFLAASLVPTARFAQPLAALVLYPMLAISGLFVPISVLPPTVRSVARVLPLTHAVSLLTGIWHHDPWIDHLSDLVALALTFVICAAAASIVFRWE